MSDGAKTLPAHIRAWPEAASLDGVRKFIARRPDLKALGTVVGPTRVLSMAEAEQIRAAYFGSRRAKTAAAAG